MTTLEKIIKMSEMPAIEIINNANGNRQFPTIANLATNPMIEFYHGIGDGVAIVDSINNEVRGFLYYSDNDDSIESSIQCTIEEIKGLEKCSVWDCEFSATQILFPKN